MTKDCRCFKKFSFLRNDSDVYFILMGQSYSPNKDTKKAICHIYIPL